MTEPLQTQEDILALARRNQRVCPLPQQWNRLYELLPDKRRVGNGWQPALPLILAAWDTTPAMMKMLRLQEHIEWATDHGALPQVARFLASLPEDQWLHHGE
jgi:hypothetical protein